MSLFERAAFFLLALCLSCAAVAQRTLNVAQAQEQRVALVIGNSAYQDAPLANPVNDATDMAKALENAGFKVILRRNAGMREMRQAIRQFATELRRADAGLFYFAGHGVQVRGNNYLVPVAAELQSEADVEDLAIDANYVLRTMEESQVKVSIVVLDACRNNPFARSFRSASRGLAQMNAATGSLIAFATAPGAVAADGSGRNGVYTKHLLNSLRQRDTDILKVFQRTRAGVVKETAGRQTPWESTSLIGDFYFRPPAGNEGGAPALAAQQAERIAATPSSSQRISTGGPMQVELLTSAGTISLELYPEKAPKTVENFIQYVKDGHYNGTIFHRVIPGFMVQGGGMTPSMAQKTTRAPVPIESKNGLKNQTGSVAMARTGDPNSATAQFFINVNNNDFLNYPGQDGHGYTVFGKVVSGMDVVNKIVAMPTASQGMNQNVPRTPIVIESASVVGGK